MTLLVPVAPSPLPASCESPLTLPSPPVGERVDAKRPGEGWVESYVGIPFRKRGRDRRGADCFGLARMIQREVFGRELPAHSTVPSTDTAAAQAALTEGREAGPWRRVERDEARAGDMALMRAELSTDLSHCGVVVEGPGNIPLTPSPSPARRERMAEGRVRGLLIHSEPEIGAVLARFDDPTIRHRIDSFWRYEVHPLTPPSPGSKSGGGGPHPPPDRGPGQAPGEGL